MIDPERSSRPKDLGETEALLRIHHLRQAAAWAPVVWFPLVLVLVSIGASSVGLGLGIAGAAFSGILCGVVAVTRCPRCNERYASVSGGIRKIWQRDRCTSCGLSRYSN